MADRSGIDHEPELSELWLAQVGVYLNDMKSTRMHGVGDVTAQLAPDPALGGQRGV